MEALKALALGGGFALCLRLRLVPVDDTLTRVFLTVVDLLDEVVEACGPACQYVAIWSHLEFLTQSGMVYFEFFFHISQRSKDEARSSRIYC